MARRKLFGWFGRPRFALALIAFAVSVGTGGAQAEERDRPIEIAQAVRPDPAAVFAGLKPLADKGDADAQARVAAFYCAGVGVAKNVVECIRYYRLAADSGNTRAQVNLAARYLTGNGTPTNHVEAARLAKLAAIKGDSMGEVVLAMCYELGAGVPKDSGEALRLYGLAAGKGNASARTALARLSGNPAMGSPAMSPGATPSVARGGSSSPTIAIALRRVAGVLVVPAMLNEGVVANFVVDSGASDVVIPESVAQMLRQTGKLSESDFTGSQTARLADGSTVRQRTFVLHSLRVGNKVLENVRASLAPGKGVPLLGQSFLQRFSAWAIDNERQVLVLREAAR
jgi:clan AA aspartic protease (TIGR02281 family)